MRIDRRNKTWYNIFICHLKKGKYLIIKQIQILLVNFVEKYSIFLLQNLKTKKLEEASIVQDHVQIKQDKINQLGIKEKRDYKLQIKHHLKRVIFPGIGQMVKQGTLRFISGLEENLVNQRFAFIVVQHKVLFGQIKAMNINGNYLIG